MSLVSIQNLSLTLHETSLLPASISSWARASGWALSLPTGADKTSLLRLLSRGGRADKLGTITRSRGVKIGYVSQYVPADLLNRSRSMTSCSDGLDEEARDYESWRADIVLDDLNVHRRTACSAPSRQLSGGWQRLALLARAWVSEPDVLLSRRTDQPSGP
jgi:ATPase subunit of ABC transporter with duplicated ATPase domains